MLGRQVKFESDNGATLRAFKLEPLGITAQKGRL